MDPNRWKQIDELFDEVSELPKNLRLEFLSERCNGDEELKKEVLSLLAAQEKAEKFMENSAMNLMAKQIAEDAPTVIDHSLIGKTIGRYRVEGMLGAGGMGEVYLAYDNVLKRKFALKILPAEFVEDNDRLQRFQREAQAVSALNHPNIVTIYDVGNVENLHFIAAEYIEGNTVRNLIDNGLKLTDTLSIVSQTAEALAAAHQNGIIHRDIKPENIMVRPDGYVKILDFGLAKLVEDNHPANGNGSLKTQKGIVMGTLAYMSPEQATGDHVDHRTDIWSLGVVLYEMLTGKKPFKSDDKKAAYNAILSLDPQPVSSVDNSLPPSLDSILGKFLEKDPELRYQTASDFRADLKRLKRELDSSPTWSGSNPITQPTSQPVQIHKSDNRKIISIGAGVLALVILGFFGWFFLLRNKTPNAIDWMKAKRTQLTEHSKIEYFPSLSPDGKFFVYAGEVDGDFDIYRQKSAAGAKADNLTENSSASDTQPAFSPNGEFIAFRSEREQKGIYVMGETGENPRRVADFGYHPSWSPDGKEIVVSTQEILAPNVKNYESSQLWIINVESGEKRLLTEMNAVQPSWSPNGKQIAFWFSQTGSNKRDVAIISASGGEPVIIGKNDSATEINMNPVWSPDGNFLYYVSNKDENISFWRVKIDQTSGKALSEPELVLSPSKRSHHITFSADGTKMAYVEREIKSNIQSLGYDDETGKTIGEPSWVTSGDRQLSRPELSLDGNFFVSRLVRRGQDDIVKVNRQTKEMIDLTNDKAIDRYARWSPDGQKISFTTDRTGKHEIWTVDASGSNFKQITFNNEKDVNMPNWSPDGKQMSFRLNEKNFLIDLQKEWNEQKPVELPPTPNNATFLIWDWSPDGNYLIGTFMSRKKEEKGIGYYSFKTQTYQKISDVAEIPMWLSDSRRISYAYENKAYILDILTLKKKEIQLPQPEGISTFSVSRDNKLVYYTVDANEADIWLLDISENKDKPKAE